MLRTYEEWKAGVVSEHDNLHKVVDYLNPDGKERMLVFDMDLLQLQSGWHHSVAERRKR